MPSSALCCLSAFMISLSLSSQREAYRIRTSTRCGAALVKELERAGIPSAHVCSITSVAQTLGSNRIIPAPRVGIPMGDRDLDPKAEKALRRAIVEVALESLQTEIKEQKLFPQHV